VYSFLFVLVFAFSLKDCSPNFVITKDRECTLLVNSDADERSYNIGINKGSLEKVRIISNPQTIMFSDKDKLLERFGDSTEVESLLAETYTTAAKENAIVYDLGDYLDSSSMWNSMSEYTGDEYVR